LLSCASCAEYKQELECLQDALCCLSGIKAPPGFTEDLLAKLPKKATKTLPQQYLSPRIRFFGATAALMLLLGSPLYMLVEAPRPVVESTDNKAQFHIVDNTVIIPEGTVVSGDIRVFNGHLKIAGQVRGSVHLVSSGYSLEDGGAVAGRVEIATWSWLEKLRFGLDQIRHDVRSYVKGALK